jgi:hypothetical protein
VNQVCPKEVRAKSTRLRMSKETEEGKSAGPFSNLNKPATILKKCIMICDLESVGVQLIECRG